MAISRVKSWITGEVLYASDLNAEFSNIIDNALALISPLTGVLDANSNRIDNLGAGTVSVPSLNRSGDTNTGIYFPAADQVSLVAGGQQVLQASGYTSATNYFRMVPSQAGLGPSFQTTGTDTDIPMRLVPAGTGYVLVPAGRSTSDRFYPGVAVGRTEEGLVSVSAGVLDLIAGGRRVLQASAYNSATNYLQIVPSQAGSPVRMLPAGADTNIDLQLEGKGSGLVVTATAFRPAAHTSNPPPANALLRENIVKGWINFKGTITASIYDSFNVGSFSRNGVGEYLITWSRAFAATTYAWVGSTMADDATSTYTQMLTPEPGGWASIAAGSLPIDCRTLAGAQSDIQVGYVIAIGDQA